MIDRIVYGGAFDPPHLGHVESVQVVLQHLPTAQVLVIPSRHPAVVSGKHKNPSAPYDDRMKMCEIAFLNLDTQSRITISDIESDTRIPWYTIDTLMRLKEIFPLDRLWLMMGQDQLQAFARWHRPLDILKTAGIIAVRREYSDHQQEQMPPLFETLKSTASSLGLHFKWDESASIAQFTEVPSRLLLLDESIAAAESSNIRGKLKQAIHVGQKKIPREVFRYIQARGLYSANSNE